MALNWGAAGQGAATGASAGAMFGPWGAAIGGVAGGAMGLMSGDPNEPYRKAQREAEFRLAQARGYEMPFVNNANDIYKNLREEQYALNDPAALENKWASSYEQSPYAQRMLQMNQAAGMDEAAQQGLLGSSAALGNIQLRAGDIVKQDRQQYMNDLMQKYMQAIGLGENIYGIGAQSAGNIANQTMGFGGDIANLTYNKSQAPMNGMAQGMGAIGDYFQNRNNQGNASMFNLPAASSSSVPAYAQPTAGWS